MRHRRGLTLVEVLAATVLLAVMAAVCTPLLRQSMRALDQAPVPFAPHELAAVADTVAADPGRYGAEGVEEITDQEIPWPDEPERPPITLRLIVPEGPETDHAWLALTCGGVTVHRWINIVSLDLSGLDEDEPPP